MKIIISLQAGRNNFKIHNPSRIAGVVKCQGHLRI
jgi:hypothetical protein